MKEAWADICALIIDAHSFLYICRVMWSCLFCRRHSSHMSLHQQGKAHTFCDTTCKIVFHYPFPPSLLLFVIVFYYPSLSPPSPSSLLYFIILLYLSFFTFSSLPPSLSLYFIILHFPSLSFCRDKFMEINEVIGSKSIAKLYGRK